MTTLKSAPVDVLAPVREALLAAARADADQIVAAAEADADAVLAAARDQAARILGQARQEGLADAAALVAADRSRARRRARVTVLRARREAYEVLRSATRAAAARLRDEPEYPELRARLVAAARRALGPDARVQEAEGGGIVAESPGHRLDLSLSGFADRAFDVTVTGEPT
ncbi:V-type ATP synthase subunit E family protein [Planosporangium sp. 12N6]|uniref:V-type ATP synthase subunit E family protein n=1 Tax=Planosporangium spinosum TaxID=3402278 RepID=UPI003CF02421